MCFCCCSGEKSTTLSSTADLGSSSEKEGEDSEMRRYTIESILHSGPNTTVYCVQGDELLTVKVLRSEHPSPSALASLQHEFEITRSLEPLGFRSAHTLSDFNGHPALFLSFLPGSSLSSLPLPLSLHSFFSIALPLLRQLSSLHRHNLMHMDIKPHNILFDPLSSLVHLIDFGLAQPINRRKSRSTELHALQGSLPYMSPEQTGRMNVSIDHRTDLYSLGVVFFQLLTHALPFQALDPMGWIYAHIAQQPPIPHLLNPDVPPLLSNIILKLLSKSPAERYQSADGLLADLDKAHQFFLSSGDIPLFPLAQSDFNEQFQFPQKLYGRTTEIASLLQAFKLTLLGHPSWLIVSGYSGVGKTELIQEIQHPVVHAQGHFISGKFDQYQRSIPFSAIIQAFRDLMHQILSEGASKVDFWKKQLSDALGTQGAVLIQVIPEVQWLMGPQPPVPELPSSENEARFQKVFQKFIEVFAHPQHPLALFLDDLQWIDSASLRFLQQLKNSKGIPSLLVLGSYRDHEVSSSHPLRIMLDEGKAVPEIHLDALSVEHVSQLLADMFDQKPEEVEGFSRTIHQKTNGNPFFVQQFLYTLYQEGILSFSSDAKCWEWDLEKAVQMGFSDNVIDLMSHNLKKLPLETLEGLKWAACLGNTFDLQTLSMARKKTAQETLMELWSALQEGYIEQNGEQYRFLHDRIQQTAYGMIKEDEREAIHLEIGRLLERGLSEEATNEELFRFIGHLNLGSRLIEDKEECLGLAKRNLGIRAKNSTAYEAAVKYLTSGIEILGDKSWEEEYELSYQLHYETASCKIMSTDHQGAEKDIEKLLENAKSPIQIADISVLKMVTFASLEKIEESIEIGIESLEAIGVDIKRGGINERIDKEIERALENISNMDLEYTINTSVMDDPYDKAVFSLLREVSLNSYYIPDPLSRKVFELTTAKMVNLSLEKGSTDTSAFAYCTFAVLLGPGMGDYRAMERIADLGIKLAEYQGNAYTLGRSYYLLGALIYPWKRPSLESLGYLERSYPLTREVGDLNGETSTVTMIVVTEFQIGRSLEKVKRGIERYLDFIFTVTQKVNTLTILQQVIKCLKGQTKGSTDLEDGYLSSKEIEKKISDTPKIHIAQRYYSLKAYLCYIYDEIEEGKRFAEKGVELRAEKIGLGMQIYAEDIFIYSLILLSRPLDAKNIEIIERNQQQMRVWSDHNPYNYLHKYLLVEAEWAKIQGRFLEAYDLFEQAILSAQKTLNLKDLALIYELTAKFHLSRGSFLIGRTYLKEAHYAYSRWGAYRKAQDLEERYPQYLMEVGKQVVDAKSTLQPTSEIQTSTVQYTNDLDLQSVMKASQTISGEIRFDKLLEQMMGIVIETAGAERGSLILKEEGKWKLKVVQTGREGPKVEGEFEEGTWEYSEGITHYVKQTREDVVLHEAGVEGNFTREEYIQKKGVKSVICTPILNKGEMVGMLYLENNRTSHAFTKQRVEVLQLLSSQIAISIENANLYESLERKVKERTIELEKAYEELKSSEEKIRHMAYHDNLTGLPNRKVFEDRMSMGLSRGKRKGERLGVMFLDLDGFKKINDRYGHEAGDEVLREVSQRLKKLVRESDTVSRFGGDEFVFLLQDISRAGDLKGIAKRVIAEIGKGIEFRGEELRVGVRVGVSIGISVYPRDGKDGEELIKKADEAMYLAKRSGKNAFRLYTKG